MTRKIIVGDVVIGGGADVSVQSMTDTPTADIASTIQQIHELHEVGCEIVRLGIPDEQAANAIVKIKAQSPLPIVADIHFDYKLALLCINNDVDKLRINPGNIGAKWKIQEIAHAAKDKGIPIRVGVNWGSVPQKLKKSGEAKDIMVELAEKNFEPLLETGFEDIIVSLKASNVPLMVVANELFASKYDFPLHLGVTEAGLPGQGSIRSAIGIGSLLLKGIGDTIRVSLTGNPVKEIPVAKSILGACNLRKFAGMQLVSCPTCSRKRIDVEYVANKLQNNLSNLKSDITVAVMGCEVNGPGEARDADIGVAGTIDGVLIFAGGQMIERFRGDINDEMINSLVEMIRNQAFES